MNRNKLSRYFLFLAIITFATVFILVVQKSYENLIGPIKQVQSSALIKPINPALDIEVLNSIQQKEEFPFNDDSPATLSATSPPPQLTPTP